MNGTKQSELEGLANRIALLVGDDGEAEAAGRAVGGMARRLGLTGGHLKAIFMAGTSNLAVAGRQTAELSARADRLARETGELERNIEQLEIALRRATSERDGLRAELHTLETSVDFSRNARRLRLTVGGILLLAVLVGGGFAWFGGLWPHDWVGAGAAAPGLSATGAGPAAVVRPGGATVYAEADPSSAVRAKLPSGVRVAVRQVVWRNFNQWAETQLGGRVGYVAVTALDMPN